MGKRNEQAVSTTAEPSKGLFARLFGKDQPPPTVAEVDAEIEALRVEQADIADRRAQIERGIADSWGTGAASELESEYSRLQARENASAHVLERLHGEREQARRREVLAAYERDCIEAVEATAQVEALRPQVQAKYQAYKAVRDELDEAVPPMERKRALVLGVDLNMRLGADAVTLARELADIRHRVGLTDDDRYEGELAGIERETMLAGRSLAHQSEVS